MAATPGHQPWVSPHVGSHIAASHGTGRIRNSGFGIVSAFGFRFSDFKPPALRFLLATSLLLTAANPLLAADARPDLTGRVLHEDDSPVTNATVFIYTAGPKVGTGVTCPSCYSDCSKRALTDATGAFKIPSLDPALIFRLLVVAPGHEGKYVPKTDPADGAKDITLAPLSPEKLKAKTRIAGQILDPEGQPLPGATISPEGVARGTGTQWGGTDKFVDPLAVADEQGRFWLFCAEGVDAVHAVAEGRGVARRWVELKPGRDHLVRMQEGSTVTGRIEKEGRPVKGVQVGVTTVDRAAGNFFRLDELATDKDGFFLLPNVPPDRDFVLYAKMASLRDQGAVPSKTFNSGKTGTEVKLGKLSVQPACRVAGRVVLSDGKPVPVNTRLFLGREGAWDHTEALLDAEGRFEFTDVPSEAVGLSVRIKGYKFSKRNPSLDWLNGGLVGRVTGDLTDLTLLMEPGEWRYNGEEGEAPGGQSQPRDQPLRGAKL